jgi:hypothetical protein
MLIERGGSGTLDSSSHAKYCWMEGGGGAQHLLALGFRSCQARLQPSSVVKHPSSPPHATPRASMHIQQPFWERRGGPWGWEGMGRHGRRPLRLQQREATPEMHPCETEHERTPAELSNHQVHPGGKRHHLQIAARLLLWFGHCLAAILHVRPEVPSTREI